MNLEGIIRSPHWRLWSLTFLTLTLFSSWKKNAYLYTYMRIVCACYGCMYVCVWLWTHACQYQVSVLSFHSEAGFLVCPRLDGLWDSSDHLSTDSAMTIDACYRYIWLHVHSRAQTQTLMFTWDSYCTSIYKICRFSYSVRTRPHSSPFSLPCSCPHTFYFSPTNIHVSAISLMTFNFKWILQMY